MFETIVCNSEKKKPVKYLHAKLVHHLTSSLYTEPNKLYACERASKKKRRSK